MKKSAITGIAILASMTASAQVIFNEIMQSNIDCIMDELNDFPDSWVELYNKGNAAVNLKDYKIGLKSSASSAYTLPDVTIGANSYLLIYCDKASTGLHTDFRIDSGKGDLYLFDAQGNKVDALEGIKKQPAPNVAYGRKSDGDSKWGYELTPTPGAKNAGGLSSTILPPVDFSEPGGVWKDVERLKVELSVADAPEGTIIRYTTDGSEPTLTNGSTYSKKIVARANMVIRAKAFCDGCISIPSSVQSYIFLERDMQIPVFSLVIDNKYLWDYDIGIFADGPKGNEWHQQNYFNDWRRPVNVEFFDKQGEASAINQLCEMRIQGGYTRENPLKSLAVYANKRFGTKRLDYEFWPVDKPGVHDNKSIVLRNGGNDYNGAFVRDAMSHRMVARHITTLDYQGYSPSIVFINGQYHGMLAIRERSNDDNIYSNYGGLEDIDMFENWIECKVGDDVAMRQLAEFMQTEHSFDEWCQVIDIDSYVDMMAINYWIYNWDFPNNNTVVWRKRSGNDTRWRWLLKDCDYALGIYGQYGPDLNYSDHLYTGKDDIGNGTHKYGGHILWKNLMKNENFKQYFLDHLVAYTGDFLTANEYNDILDELIEENKGEQKLSVLKWNNYNPWWPNLDNSWNDVKNWCNNRQRNIATLIKKTFGQGTAVKVKVAQSLDDATAKKAGITYCGVALRSGKFDGSDYMGRTIRLDADANSGITGWTVKVRNTTKELHGCKAEYVIAESSDVVIEPIISTQSIGDAINDTEGYAITEGKVVADGAIAIYDMTGRLVANGHNEVQLPSRGVYLLQVNGTSSKIVY